MAETCCESEQKKEKISCVVEGGVVCKEYISATGCLNTILFNVFKQIRE
jgi:hypothetical protein